MDEEHVLFLSGKNNFVSPTEWRSKILSRAVPSTISAAASLIIDVLDLSLFMSIVLSQLLYPIRGINL